MLYWPDDYDRHTHGLNQQVCNFDKIGLGTQIDEKTASDMMEYTGNR